MTHQRAVLLAQAIFGLQRDCASGYNTGLSCDMGLLSSMPGCVVAAGERRFVYIYWQVYEIIISRLRR